MRNNSFYRNYSKQMLLQSNQKKQKYYLENIFLKKITNPLYTFYLTVYNYEHFYSFPLLVIQGKSWKTRFLICFSSVTQN